MILELVDLTTRIAKTKQPNTRTLVHLTARRAKQRNPISPPRCSSLATNHKLATADLSA